jgi:ribosome-binding factor A
VTNVRVSPDLGVAHAYLSIFPSEKAEELVKNINENVKSVRYDLGKRVGKQLRVVPELKFHVDDSLDYIEHIDRLLKDR